MEGDTEKVSTEIDQRVVEMKFNNKNFERNVSTSMSTLEKFKKSLDFSGATKGVDELNRAAGKFSLKGMDESVGTVTAKFDALTVAAITAMSRITNAAYDAGVKLVKSLSVDNIAAGWQKFGEKTTSVGTLVAQGYDLSVVEQQLRRLNWFTDETSYNFTDMVSNIAKFTASGQDLESSVTALEGIANWAALSGQNASTASRAMYQLSQAMGAGVMRREDYRSIQNVSMDTEEFRQKALDAAVALGTLRKNADGSYQSLRANTKSFTISQFAEHLTEDAWFTSDVMMKVYSEYSGAVDKIYAYAEEKGITASEAIKELSKTVDENGIPVLDEFALKAFKAAQEARTWGDVVDSVKDAVSTGWMNTFELLFGNYEEAKNLFTDLANGLYDVFAEGGNRRNAVLADGLLSSWQRLTRDGIPDIEAFQDTVIATAASHGLEINRMIEEAGGFEASLKSGWLTNDILVESVYKLTRGVRELSDAELISSGYTEAQIASLKRLNDQLFSGTLNLASYSAEMQEMSGRENLVQAFWNLWNALFAVDEETGRALGVIAIFKDSIAEVFPPITGERIYAFTASIKALSERLIPTEETAGKLASVFRGLASVFDLVRQVVSAVWRTISPMFGVLGSGRDAVLSFAASIGDVITEFAAAVKEGDLFYASIQKAAEWIKDAVSRFLDFIGVGEKASSLMSKFGESLRKSSAREWFTTLSDRAKSAYEWVKELFRAIAGSDIAKILRGAFRMASTAARELVGLIKSLFQNVDGVDLLGKAFRAVSTIIGGLVGLVKSLLKNLNLVGENGALNLSGLLDLTNTGLIAGIGMMIKKLLGGVVKDITGTLNDTVGGAKGILDSLKTMLGGITGVFTEMQNKLKADSLRKIAVSIAIISASLLLLSSINTDRLMGASAALGVVTYALIEAVSSLNGLAKNKGLSGVSSSMIKISAALLIVSIALAKIGSLGWEDLGRGLTGIGAVLIMLTVVCKSLSKLGDDAKSVKKAAKAMTPMAIALLILASAMKKISLLSWVEIGKGLTGIGGVMLELVLLSRFMDSSNIKRSSSIALIGIAASLLIFSGVLKRLGDMDGADLVVGLSGMAGIIAEIVLLSNYMDRSTLKPSSAVALIGIAASLLIFQKALSNFGQMEWEEIGRGLLGIGGVLAGIVALFNLLPQKTLSGATSVLIVSAALLVLGKALSTISALGWSGIAVGLLGMAGGLAAVIAALALAKRTLTGAAALLVAATALSLLALAMQSFASLSLEQIGLGLLGLGGALAALIGAAYLVAPVTGPLLALSAAIAVVGVGMLAFGAGVTVFAIGLSMLAAGGAAAAVALAQALTVVVTTLAVLAPTIGTAFADALTSFATAMSTAGPALVGMFVTILGSLLDAAVEVVPKLLNTLDVLIDALMVFLTENLPDWLDSLFNLLDIAIDSLLRFLDGTVPKLVDGIFGLLILVMDGLITHIPELVTKLTDFIIAVLDALTNSIVRISEKIVDVIVVLVNSIVDNSLQIVNAFFDLVIDIINGLADTIREKGPRLTEAIINLVDALIDNLRDTISQWTDFAGEIVSGLAEGIRGGIGSALGAVKEVGGKVVTGFKDFFGIRSPSRVMRDEVGVFIVKGISDGIKSDDSAEEAAKKKAQNIVNAFKTELDKLDLRQKIADKELELWQADNPHADKEEAHLKELEHLRGKLQNQAEKARLAAAEWKAMSQEFGEESDAAQEAYEKFLEEQIALRKYTSELLEFRASEIDPSVSRDELGRYIMHGIASGITADTTAEDAAAQKAKNIVAAFKTELDKFDASLETADLEYKVWEAANAGASDTEKVLKEYEILDTKLTLAAQKTKTAEAEWRATTMVFGEDSEDAQSARNKYLTEQASFMEIIGSMTELEGDALFGRAMQLKARMEEAGETLDGRIEDFFSRNLDSDTMRTAMKYLDMAGPVEVVFDNAEEPVDEGIEEILDGVTKDLNVKLEEDIPKAVAAATKAAVPAITQSGAEAADAYADGFGNSFLINLLTKLDSGTLNLTEVQTAFDMGIIGQDMYQGLINGLRSKGQDVLNTVRNGASSVLDTVRGVYDEHSPSQEFYKIGEYCVIGFANAFLDLLGLATGSTERFGETAITSMFDTMAQVEALLDSGVDFQPVISPVLDLGYIRDGVQQMDAMLDTSPSYRMAASTDRYRDAARSQNATTDALNRLDKNLSNYLAESVNAMQEALDEYAEGLTVQITMKTPDGRVLAEELVQPLISVSRSKGTPFYTPKQ